MKSIHSICQVFLEMVQRGVFVLSFGGFCVLFCLGFFFFVFLFFCFFLAGGSFCYPSCLIFASASDEVNTFNLSGFLGNGTAWSFCFIFWGFLCFVLFFDFFCLLFFVFFCLFFFFCGGLVLLSLLLNLRFCLGRWKPLYCYFF